MHFEEILIIRHGEICYGISTDAVEQILRVPAITPLALTPREVRGLCAVGGNILTVMDTNLLLGLDAVDAGVGESRLLTLTGVYSHVGILVSRVVDTVGVEPAMLEMIDDPQDAVVAIYKHDREIVQLLGLEALFEGTALPGYRAKEVKEGHSREEQAGRPEAFRERFLLFKMGRERYAVGIDHVREIIALPAQMTEIAGSRPEIRGMISLRDELLVVSDLRRYYGFEAGTNDKNRVLVMQWEGKQIGLVIDEIVDIRDYLPEQVDLIQENFRNSLVSGVIHDGERLVSLMGRDVLQRIFLENEKLLVASRRQEGARGGERVMEVVVFRIGAEEYALDIEGVAEIIDKTEITPVPDAPAEVEGVINIRGQVVTIGSLYRRLGIADAQSGEEKIIVCRSGRERIGFLVNGVSDVVEVSSEELCDAREQGALFSKVLHFDRGNRLVLLFDLERLIPKRNAA